MTKLAFIVLYLMILLPGRLLSQDGADTLYTKEFIGQQLVRIAWENSGLRKSNLKHTEILNSDIKYSRFQWLDGLFISGNINEFTIDPPPLGSNFYPRYNFGYRLSYLNVSSSLSDTKRNKLELDNLMYQQEMDQLNTKAEVLRRYELYTLAQEMLKLNQERLIHINAELKIGEQEFSDGTKNLSEYNQLLDQYRNAIVDELKARHTYEMAKINIEEMLGISWEEAMHTIELW